MFNVQSSMFKVIKYPKREEWKSIVERPHLDVSQLNDTVSQVLNDIKTRGDVAVKEYELKFDHVALESLAVTEAEIDEAFVYRRRAVASDKTRPL